MLCSASGGLYCTLLYCTHNDFLACAFSQDGGEVHISLCEKVRGHSLECHPRLGTSVSNPQTPGFTMDSISVFVELMYSALIMDKQEPYLRTVERIGFFICLLTHLSGINNSHVRIIEGLRASQP